MTMNKLEFVKNGDYFIPDLTLPENRHVGKYGRIYLKFIKQKNPSFYSSLMLAGTLNKYLHDIDALARRQISKLVKSFEADAPDKATNQMAWVGYMNNAKSRAEEVVLSQLIN